MAIPVFFSLLKTAQTIEWALREELGQGQILWLKNMRIIYSYMLGSFFFVCMCVFRTRRT